MWTENNIYTNNTYTFRSYLNAKIFLFGVIF